MKYKPSEFKWQIDGRYVVLHALVGSRIYNLAENNSDYDYKVFVLPTIDDLLNNHMVSKSYKDENGNDVDLKDIRLLSQMLNKANPAYIQVLYSTSFKGDRKLIKFLKEHRFNFIANNSIGFVRSTIGICLEKLKAIEKDLPKEETNEGFERRKKFGFDTKQLLHIVRLRHLVMSLNPNKEIFQVENELKKPLILLKNHAVVVKGSQTPITKGEAIFSAEREIEIIRRHELEIIDGLNKYKPNEDPIKLLNELIKELILEQFGIEEVEYRYIIK